MAEPKTAQKTVNITVPEGMNPEQLAKLVGTFLKANSRGKQVGKAMAEANKHLRNAHKPEYYGFLKEEYVKQGLDPRTVKQG